MPERSVGGAEPDRPNILLILADDLGYSDLGCYGGEIRTPHLDQLAKSGLRFTQVYNSARCCPSRAALMTGLYPHQAGIGHFAGYRPNRPHGYRGFLQPNTVTIAEVLKEAGYGTFMSGKWHLAKPGPIEQGFDEFYGFVRGYAVDSWNPKMMVRLPEGRPSRDYEHDDYFATDAITDHALDFLDRARKKPEKPWFLYVAYQAPHFPIQAPQEDIDRYRDTYKAGWDQLRQERLKRMKAIGIIDSDATLPPRSSVPAPRVAKRHGVPGDRVRNPAWEEIPSERQADLARRMAVYAGMVDNMDQNVGRLVADLKAAGELRNTLILFLSDNGACAEWGPYGFDLPKSWLETDRRGTGVNGGTPGLASKLHTGDALDRLGGPGTGLAYGSGWANLSNTPWREYKHYTYEGGTATPLIAHWPAGIKAAGEMRDQVGFLFDITATCVDVANATYPETANGNEITPLEGVSLVPAFKDKQLPKRRLAYEHERNAAVRAGPWKLVANDIIGNEGLRQDQEWELYRIDKNRAETENLADQYPEKVESLEDWFVEEARRIEIFPRR